MTAWLSRLALSRDAPWTQRGLWEKESDGKAIVPDGVHVLPLAGHSISMAQLP